MSGMGFMIRLLFVILILSSCGNLPITYIQNFSSINSVVFGFPEYEITEEIFDEYENSFMKIRFGRGPHSILILAYIEDDIYEWVGSDGVKIFTLDGRIIKTSGLTNNFEVLTPTNMIGIQNNKYEVINLFNPDLYSATIVRTVGTNDTIINKLGKNIQVKKIEESFRVKSIGWDGKNTYYKNISTNQVETSLQNLHPRLPVAKVEYYIKY